MRGMSGALTVPSKMMSRVLVRWVRVVCAYPRSASRPDSCTRVEHVFFHHIPNASAEKTRPFVAFPASRLTVSRPPAPHTAAVAMCSAFFAILCAAGFVRVETKNKVTEIWVPQDTAIMRNRDHVEETFGKSASWQALVVRKVGSTTAALSPEAVELMYDLEEILTQIPGHDEGCVKRGEPHLSNDKCMYRGVTNLWCNRTHYEQEVGGRADPTAELIDIVNTRRSGCLGYPIERLRTFGIPTYDGEYILISVWAISMTSCFFFYRWLGCCHGTPGVSKMTGATYTASWYLYEPGDDSVAKGRRASFEQVMRREQTRLASEGWEIEFAYQEAFDSEIGESFFLFPYGQRD